MVGMGKFPVKKKKIKCSVPGNSFLIFYIWAPGFLKCPQNQPPPAVVHIQCTGVLFRRQCGNSIWYGAGNDSPVTAVVLVSTLSPERDFAVRFSSWSLRRSSPLQRFPRPWLLLISQNLAIAWDPYQTWVFPLPFKSHQDETALWKWRSWCILRGGPSCAVYGDYQERSTNTKSDH